MKATENEIIQITNAANLARALDAVRDMIPGKEYGIDDKQYKQVHLNLALIQKQTFKIMGVD